MRAKPIFLSACVIKPEDAWNLVHHMRMLRARPKSPELVLWPTAKDRAEIVNVQKVVGTPTESGMKQ
jgi:hypothetical protein